MLLKNTSYNTTSNGKIPVVGYCRFSSDMQREESIDGQKQAIMLFIQNYNSTRQDDEQYELIDYYVDRAKSGKTSDRPSFLKMMEDSKKNRFQAVIVHKLDRFSRNTIDTLSFKEELNSRGVELISAVERIEKGPSGTLTLSIMASVNTYYSQNLALEVMKGELINAQSCTFNGGIPCLGFNIINQKYEINSQEAKIVKKIFELYAQGFGYGEIIKQLNLLGYKTKKGNPFGKNSIYEILSNEKYIGNYVFNRIEHGTSKGKRNCHRYKPESEIVRIEGGIPAIISRELWDSVQALRSITHKGKCHSKRMYLLSGLVYCSCGAKMHGNCHSNGQGKDYYAYRCSSNHSKHSCSNKEIRAEYLDSYVLDTLLNHFFHDDIIPVITSQLNQTIHNESCKKSEDYVRYKDTLKMLNKAKKNLMEALKQDYSKSVTEELRDVESQIEKCQTLLTEYERKNIDIRITEDEVRKNLEKFKQYVKKQRSSELQAMIRHYVKRVTITDTTVEVAFLAAFFFCNGEKSVYYTWQAKTSINHMKYLAEYGLLTHIPEHFNKLIHSA